MFRWVQVPLDIVKNLEDDGAVVKRRGYRYHNNETNAQMVEYHVYTFDALATWVKNTTFGG